MYEKQTFHLNQENTTRKITRVDLKEKSVRNHISITNNSIQSPKISPMNTNSIPIRKNKRNILESLHVTLNNKEINPIANISIKEDSKLLANIDKAKNTPKPKNINKGGLIRNIN